MKKIINILILALTFVTIPVTNSYADVNKYVQLKDGVAFAYVESVGFVGNSILLPTGVSWEDVKFKKYENGTWVTTPVINTVTELVNNTVVQTQSTVFASDAKGDVVSPEVQTGWQKTITGSYVDAATGALVSQILPGSIEEWTREDTTTIVVNLERNYDTPTIFTGAAVLSAIQTNYENVTVIQSNGLKTTDTLETIERITFTSPKTRAQLQTAISNKLLVIEKYLNRFYTLLNGWILD